MRIISGSGSFRGRFGDHFRVGDHFGVGIISGAVHYVRMFADLTEGAGDAPSLILGKKAGKTSNCLIFALHKTV